MDFKFFKVSIPLAAMCEEGARRYPWRSMEVGDAFEVPDYVNLQAIRSSASRYGRIKGRKFSVRRIDGRMCAVRTA